MVAHLKPSPTGLLVTFERDGEQPISVRVPDGEKAIVRATAMILMHGRLQPGDKLTITAAE